MTSKYGNPHSTWHWTPTRHWLHHTVNHYPIEWPHNMAIPPRHWPPWRRRALLPGRCPRAAWSWPASVCWRTRTRPASASWTPPTAPTRSPPASPPRASAGGSSCGSPTQQCKHNAHQQVAIHILIRNKNTLYVTRVLMYCHSINIST